MYINLKQLISLVKMSVLKSTHLQLVVSLFVIGSSACTGRGINVNQQTPALIDSHNTTQIIGAVAMEVGAFTGFIDPIAGNLPSHPDALLLGTQIGLRGLAGGTDKLMQLQPETYCCAGGGSVTVWGEFANLDTLSVGDIININASKCDDGYDQAVNGLLDGLLQMTIVRFAGDIYSSEFLLGVELLFSNLMVTEKNGDSIALNGGISATLDMRTPAMAKINVFGESFTISSSAMGKTHARNFHYSYTEDASGFPVVSTHNGKGTVASSEFVGTVSYDTPINFEGSEEKYPHTGELRVTGANNASLRLITLDDINIQIDADYNGDNIVDETFNLTWRELEK